MGANMVRNYENRKHSVIIDSRLGKGTFTGLLRENIEYPIKVFYDTLFKDFINWRSKLNMAQVGIFELLQERGLKGIYDKLHMVMGGLSWTRRIGGMPEYMEFQLPVRLWVEDSEEDVLNKLKVLYDIAVPEMGDFITWEAQLEVRVIIGDWFLLEQAFVTNINHRWSEALVNGVPMYCDVDINISSVYAIDRKHMDISGKKITVREMYEKK
jgi:hypothetical protein